MSSPAYERALTYLYDLQKYGIKFGLSSTNNLLNRLGKPHRKLQAIHIAGTNGKGSTAAMLSAILTGAGQLVGLYTSPHLVRFNERIRVNEQDVGDNEILDVFRRVHKVVDKREPPTFFEMTTAMALSLFAERQVDWAILEVGMGGRLDATNVIKPQVAIITNVSLDHQEFLGATLSRIAWEKAGIIKQRVPLVTAVKQPAALAVVKACCLKAGAPHYRVGRQIRVRCFGKQHFNYRGLRWRLPHLDVPLAGRHQVLNAATALGALEVLENQGYLKLNSEQIREGLAKTRWAGRLEWLSRQPAVLLDGAHNYAGVVALCQALRKEYRYRRLILVLGIMADKDLRGMCRKLAPLAEHIILTQPRYERAAEPAALGEVVGEYSDRVELIRSVETALERAKELASPEDLVVVTGSLYFVGEVKEIQEDQSKSGSTLPDTLCS